MDRLNEAQRTQLLHTLVALCRLLLELHNEHLFDERYSESDSEARSVDYYFSDEDSSAEEALRRGQPHPRRVLCPLIPWAMPKALSFKGDPKPKKRKRTTAPSADHARRSPSPDDDQTWVLPSQASDISGPVMLIFSPSTNLDLKPGPDTDIHALATDPSGRVFLSPLENILDSRPETAEPHDTRQVLVASRAAGMSAVSLKGSAGYLSATSGVSAGQTAVSTKEGWEFLPYTETTNDIPVEREGWFLLRNSAEYLSLSGNKVAMAEEGHPVCVRMQARFKPKLAQEKKDRAEAKVGRAQIEREAGRKLDDDEIRRLKKARKNGTYYEEMLDVRQKGKHDKFA